MKCVIELWLLVLLAANVFCFSEYISPEEFERMKAEAANKRRVQENDQAAGNLINIRNGEIKDQENDHEDVKLGNRHHLFVLTRKPCKPGFIEIEKKCYFDYQNKTWISKQK